MKIDGRLFLVVIMALVMIPGACATTSSASGGTSVDTSGGSVHGNTIVNNNGARQEWSANGIVNLNENHLLDFGDAHVTTKSIMTPDGLDPSYSISDSKGNFANVNWDYSLKPGTSSVSSSSYWSQPYSSTAGYGVSEQLSMSVGKAYWISAGSSASNKEGDNAQVSTYVGLSDPQTTSSLNNYYTQATAYTNQAGAYQSANYATSTYPITISGTSNNHESDLAKADILATTGTINYPTMNVIATKTSDYVYPTVSSIVTPGTGTIDASTSNKVGDNTNFKLQVTSGSGYSGNILSPNYYALSQTTLGESKLVSLSSAYGATATITSHAQNLALARDPTSGSILHTGSADFEALKTSGNAFTNIAVDTTATGTSDVTISSTGFPKTALLLEPFKAFGFGNLYGSVGYTLENKGYAVTDYSDAGVTSDKVYKLDESTVSVINTHGVVDSTTAKNPNTLGLAITYDPTGSTNTQYIPWTQLQPYLKTPNGMIILSACDPFNTNSGTTTFTDGTKTTTPGKYTVSKAQVSGGFVGSVLIADTTPYLSTLFTQLAAGNTVSTANTAAAKSINNRQILTLQGITSWKLP